MVDEMSNKYQNINLQLRLGQMITGYWALQALRCALLLNIADLLKEKDRSAEELADHLKVKSGPLYRLLRALASIGIFEENTLKCFSLTPLAELLCESHPHSVRNYILMLTGPIHLQPWEELNYSIETGKPSFNKIFNKSIFEFLTEHPVERRIFDEAMTNFNSKDNKPMIDSYDFSNFKMVVDVGGGNGSTLLAILKHIPSIKGVLFDMPQAVDNAKPGINKSPMSDRILLEGGNFFSAVTPGADAYILRHIIHSWPDEDAVTILKNCVAAMKKGAKILIIEAVIPVNNDPYLAKWQDLLMLLIGGMERTLDQYKLLLEKAGLKLNRIIPTATEISILEAVEV